MKTSSTKASKVKLSANKLKKKAPALPSSLSKEEVMKFELDAARLKNIRHELENQELRDVIELRRIYSAKILKFTTTWSIITLILLILDSWKIFGFDMDNTVLTTIVATSIGNMFALASVVARGIFTRN